MAVIGSVWRRDSLSEVEEAMEAEYLCDRHCLCKPHRVRKGGVAGSGLKQGFQMGVCSVQGDYPLPVALSLLSGWKALPW